MKQMESVLLSNEHRYYSEEMSVPFKRSYDAIYQVEMKRSQKEIT